MPPDLAALERSWHLAARHRLHDSRLLAVQGQPADSFAPAGRLCGLAPRGCSHPERCLKHCWTGGLLILPPTVSATGKRHGCACALVRTLLTCIQRQLSKGLHLLLQNFPIFLTSQNLVSFCLLSAWAASKQDARLLVCLPVRQEESKLVQTSKNKPRSRPFIPFPIAHCMRPLPLCL